MANNRISDEDKAISRVKAAVKISEYNDSIFKNGFFNPMCPIGYNYLTGRTEDTAPPAHRICEYNLKQRVNGNAIFEC